MVIQATKARHSSGCCEPVLVCVASYAWLCTVLAGFFREGKIHREHCWEYHVGRGTGRSQSQKRRQREKEMRLADARPWSGRHTEDAMLLGLESKWGASSGLWSWGEGPEGRVVAFLFPRVRRSLNVPGLCRWNSEEGGLRLLASHLFDGRTEHDKEMIKPT